MIAAMKLCWTFNGIPELSHLGADEKRQLIRQAVGVRGRVSLFVRSILFGMVFSGALAMFIGWRSELYVYIVTPCGLLLAIAWWQIELLRIRSELRQVVKDAFRGERLPACLKCGYDLRGSAVDPCPECGAPVRVPRNGAGSAPRRAK